MSHQPGLGHPGGGYGYDPRHPPDPHLQAHLTSPRPEHFPPSSPIFTGPPTLAGSVTPSCSTPPLGTTNIPRYPIPSPTMYHTEPHHSTPVSPSRNVMDPSMQLHYSYPYYRGQRPNFPEEQPPITSSPGGTPHLPSYPAGMLSQPMSTVPPYPPNITRRQTGKGTRRNPGLKIDFSPMKEGGTDLQTVSGAGPMPYPMPLRSPAYPGMGGPMAGNVSEEVKELRRKVAEYFYQNVEMVKKRYEHSLQELFFLQHGLNIIDFPAWKRRPTQQWITFHATHKLEDELDFLNSPTNQSGMEQLHHGSSMDYIALQHKFYTGNRSTSPSPVAFTNMGSAPPYNNSYNTHNPHHPVRPSTNQAGAHIDLASSKLFMSKGSGLGQASGNGHASMVGTSHANNGGRSLVFPRDVTQSKEDIMLEARKEADILKRVAELRKEGLWSSKRLPKVQEPSRNKTHWDYVLEEMAWLATDFAQERRWKKNVAKKLSRSVLKYHQDIKAAEVKAEKQSTVRLQKIASSIAKEVRQFWINIDKVVRYKVQSRMEEKRKKALDIHLNFIVGQTEKYSSWLAESLKESKPGSSVSSSVASSVAESSPSSSHQDAEYESDLEMSERSDDEETLDVEEANEDKEFDDPDDEIKALQRESEIPMDDLLDSLPLEMFAEHKDGVQEDDGTGGVTDVEDGGKDSTESSKEDNAKHVDDATSKAEPSTSMQAEESAPAVNNQDEEFVLRETMVDVDDEGTLEEEENMDQNEDYDEEISMLEAEGDLPIEELMRRYNVEEDDEDVVHREEESDMSSDDDESSEEEEGTEFLLQSDLNQEATTKSDSESPTQDLTDAAATAESLQPTGYTLETTQVKTKIPFLLRGGTLREYQHIGLDWLVTMYEKCLNGILADEMGLGKTIMTIAVLAHLACEKGNWGPHLIVVPTSVTLNWEMECKKWCPGFKILTYYGSQKERKIKRTGWTKPNAFHICITSYKLVVQDHQAFRRKQWKYLILDEAQNIKNFKSQRWQYLLNFNTQRRLLLTGTPLQNNLMELWSLMHFLMPHLFESHNDFKEWFSNPLSGMIEGSSEYNESLVKRLHKILRPFLLRRLKSEVEKQMPKKYEHIIRCRLSKRQRVLYDDFMSQTRTKETLQSGHLLSVINILMQLRKVCNHPDLFEARPTVSSLKMAGLLYTIPSLALTALANDPLTSINLSSMNLVLTQLEFTLSAFAGHRVKQLQTPKVMITEVDTYATIETPYLQPVKTEYTTTTTNNTTTHNHNNMVNEQTLTTNHAPKSPQMPNLTPWGSKQVVEQLSPRQFPEIETLCPGYGGEGYAPPSEQDHYNALNTNDQYMNNDDVIQSPREGGYSAAALNQIAMATRSRDSSSTVVYSHHHHHHQVAGGLTKLPRTLNLSEIKNLGNANGHVPLKNVLEHKTKSPSEKPVVVDSHSKETLGAGTSSPFSLASLEEQRSVSRTHKLRFLARINERRCMAQPVYGQDLVQSVTIFRTPLQRTWCKVAGRRTPAVCETAQTMTKTPQERVQEMTEIIKRFVFFIPSVTCPRITMHASHPPPSCLAQQRQFEMTIKNELSPKLTLLHPIVRGKLLQLPEVRLIQYDCGKLQTMDLLLRKLKTGKHRALIFTQMTKMLDILERFLNYHGYLYLRLDGATRVEQRQILMERFNNDRKIFCFILSTRSGGVGVNLTGADTVIFYDSDWNPTMDAQAQDRCHRIGQTRDVHIYRLISEKTIEENILKKAHQKKLLGDIAIEGGNFTTTVLKEATIRDLFTVNIESDLQAIVGEALQEKKDEEEVPAKKTPKSENAFEQALMKAEDEQDVKAASLLKAEQAAELDEFDENIPLDDENNPSGQNMSKVEEELHELEEQLSAVERYAVHFVESSYNFVTTEQLDLDQKTVELSKKGWELDHIQAMKEEDERRAAMKDDLVVDDVTYPSDQSRQGFVDEMTGEDMPVWTPPTPPCDDKADDVYVDHTQNILYESTPLPEVSLPRQTRTRRYLGDYKKHGKRSRFSFRLPYKDSIRRHLRKPQSMFDRRALEAFFKSRRNALSNAKKAKMKQTKQPQQQQAQQAPQQHPAMMRQPGDMQSVDTGPEWFVHEDWALLQAVHYLQEVPTDLTVTDLGHTPNWLLVSDIVNASSRAYRTARQCRDRYINVVMPREEGKIPTMDDGSKKLKAKMKTPYPTTDYPQLLPAGVQQLNKPKKGTRMFAIHNHDGGRSSTTFNSTLFELVKKTSLKRKPNVKQSLGSEPYQKPTAPSSSSAASVKVEETYLDPARIATMKVERIQREKSEALARQQQQLQQQQQQQTSQQPDQQQNQQVKTGTKPAGVSTATPQQDVAKTTQLQTNQQQPPTAQNVQGFTTQQRLVPHSQIMTATQQKITAGQMTGAQLVAGQQTVSGLPSKLVKSTGGSTIVVKTPPGNVATNFAAINKRMSHVVTTTNTMMTAKVVTTSDTSSRPMTTQPTAVQFLATTANAGVNLQTTSSAAAITQAVQRLPEAVLAAAKAATPGKTYSTTTKTITPQQFQYLQRLQQQQQQQQQQRRQAVQQQQAAGKQMPAQVAAAGLRKVGSASTLQKQLAVGTTLTPQQQQQRVNQAMKLARPVQQQPQQQQPQQQTVTAQQPQQTLQQQTTQQTPTQQQTAQQAQTQPQTQQQQQQAVAQQQVKRIQLPSGQQVTAGGIVTAGATAGSGGGTKHVVKLPMKNTQLTPQHAQAYRTLLQQQRLQQQQKQQQQLQQQLQQAQSSNLTGASSTKSTTTILQTQLQSSATSGTTMQLVTLPKQGLVSTKTMPQKTTIQVNKPATTGGVTGTSSAQQQSPSPNNSTPPPATTSSSGTGGNDHTAPATTVSATTSAGATAPVGTTQSTATTQHQSPYAMRSRSQSK